MGGEDFDESTLTDDVIGLAVGSPGMALYYAEHAKDWCPLAVDFIEKSLSQDYTDLFFELEDSGLEDPAVVNRFLEVLSFLISDLLRMQSGAPLRIPESTGRVNLERYPQVGASALELALVSVQETMSRIASRRMVAAICLQNLSMKLFEGYK